MDRSNRIQKIVVTALAVFLLQACDKVPKGGDAQLSVSLTSPSQKAVTQSSFAKPQSHTAGEVTLFNRVELTVKNRNGEILTGGNLGDGHSSVSLTVPSQIPLLLEGSAFLNGTLLYRGSAPVLPIRPGGSSRARLVLFAVDASGEQIPIDIGLNEKPSPAVSEASVITNNNRLVLFSSTASDLVEGDTNNSRDLFLKDLISNETINVHTDKDGNSANADVGSAAEHADMSADGRYVVFSSLASNLVEGDDNQLYDVYLKDLSDGSIQRIPRPVDITGSYNALYPQISDDGSRIAFVLKSIDGSQMLYILYDSRREEPTVGIVNSIVGLPQMSGDGNRFVYTTAAENRLYVETRFSGTPQAETVFNPDDDVTRFQVAISYDGDTLIVVPSHNYGDMFANHVYRVYWGEGVATELLSTDLDGELLGSEPKTDINVSDDGRFVVFVYNGVVYVKELASGLLQALRPGTRPFVSADGSYIGYTSSADQRLFYEVNPFVDPPATPQNIVAIPGDKTISLSWDADENASGFRLYVSPASGITQTNYTQIDGAEVFSVEGNSFTYPGELVNGQVYYFIVSAVEGTLESAASSELSAVPSLLLGQSDLPFTGELGAGVLSEFLTISGLQSGKTYQFFFNPIGSSIGARIFSDANKNNLLCEIQFTTFLNDCSFSLVESNEAYVEIALN
ncbi:MAG: hypothetical protein OEX00_07685, partial [Gammaproteobacteria bacterium]|nr:hypothetical protein [Gammaproteobacteria bacterium]